MTHRLKWLIFIFDFRDASADSGEAAESEPVTEEVAEPTSEETPAEPSAPVEESVNDEPASEPVTENEVASEEPAAEAADEAPAESEEAAPVESTETAEEPATEAATEDATAQSAAEVKRFSNFFRQKFIFEGNRVSAFLGLTFYRHFGAWLLNAESLKVQDCQKQGLSGHWCLFKVVKCCSPIF